MTIKTKFEIGEKVWPVRKEKKWETVLEGEIEYFHVELAGLYIFLVCRLVSFKESDLFRTKKEAIKECKRRNHENQKTS